MKVFKITFILLLVLLLVLSVSLYIFSKKFDINKYTDDWVEQISSQLRREISVGDVGLSVSLTKGIVLNVTTIRVADDSFFSNEPFVFVKSLAGHVDILPLLTKGEITIKSIEVNSPRVQILRNKSGALNVDSFANQKKDYSTFNLPGQEMSALETTVGEASTAQPEEELPNILIQRIVVKNGELVYRDDSGDAPVNLRVNNVFAGVDDVRLSQPFKFQVSGSLLSSGENFNINGRAQYLPGEQKVRLSALRFNSNLALLSVTKLNESFPQAQALKLQDNFGGELDLLVEDVILVEEDLNKLQGVLKITNGRAATAHVPAPLTDIQMSVELSQGRLNLNNFNAKLSGGGITAGGAINDVFKSPRLDFNFQAEGLGLKEIVPPFDPEIRLKGDLDETFAFTAQGLTPEQIIKTINGQSRLNVRNGVIENFNALKFVLDQLKMFPGLVSKIQGQLPDRLKEYLKQKDTPLQKVDIQTDVHNDVIIIKKAEVSAEGFTLETRGSLDWNQNMTIQPTITLSRELSQVMVKTVVELQGLMNNDGRINIPLVKYSGKMAEYRPYPDLEYIGKRVIINKGREELDKVLDKVFDRKQPAPAEGPQDPGQPAPEPQESPAPKQKSPEEQLIEGILDTIFK